MKITFVNYSMWPPDFGGELLLTLERFETLAQRGHQMVVLTSGAPGRPRQEQLGGVTVLRSPVVGTSRLGRLGRRFLFPWWVMRQAELTADVVHLGSVGGPTEGREWHGLDRVREFAASKGAGIVAVHSLADREGPGLVTAGRAAGMRLTYLRGLDAVVGVSPRLHEDLRDALGPRARLLINGVRDDLFVPLSPGAREAERRKQGVLPGEVVFAFLGTVCRRKGFDLVSAAFLGGRSKGYPWRLWSLGPCSTTENRNISHHEYQALMEPLRGCASATSFGRIDDRSRLARLLGAVDVFLFPSRREGLGLAPLEAMATGTPAVIARLPGVTEILCEDRVSGWFVPPGELEPLEEAMVMLSGSPDTRKEAGLLARRHVSTRFGWGAHVDAWERLYEELAAVRGRDPRSAKAASPG